MDGDGWREIVIIVIMGVGIALTGLIQTLIGVTSRQRLRLIAGRTESPLPSGQKTFHSIVDPRRLLFSTMALLQVAFAVIATAQLTRLLDRTFNGDLSWVAVAIVVAIYLVFGQALGRALAAKDLERFLNGTFRLAMFAAMLLRPINWLVERIALFFAHAIPGSMSADEPEGLEEELHPIRYAADDEVIGASEREMIDGILSLEELTARDIMVPRLDIVAVDRFVAPRELIETITRAGHSRIPVYQESIDRVLGVLYAKDLLPFVIGNTNRIPLLDLIRPAFVVPESKRLNELFTELKRARIHIAIVADEYGGTAGLVTIEDILEEIVGDIQDEYDFEEAPFQAMGPGVILADGRLPIEDVEEALDIEFEEDDDFGTLGGFVHKHLGRLPIKGDVFEAEGVRVEILGVERHRVRKLRITKLAPADEENGRRARRNDRGTGQLEAVESVRETEE